MKRVVVGLSGGVDSSVAAYLLKEQGYDVVGLFMRNWHDTTGTLEGDCPWYDDQMFAELTAKRLDIPFHFIDLSDEYRRRVVDYMFAEYGRGRTPNPDVLCNREIKFDAFLQAALKLGADYVATGHYCRREVTETAEGPVYRLLAGNDPNKDQSYFLCQLTQEQLSRALFPIGHLLKPEVRRIAAEQHLATAQRKDSQGICFVGKVDLPVFLQQQLKAREGAIVEIPASWPGYALRGRIAAPGERSTAWELPADGPFSQEQLDALAEPYRYTPEAGQAGGHAPRRPLFHHRPAQRPRRGRLRGTVVRDRERRGNTTYSTWAWARSIRDSTGVRCGSCPKRCTGSGPTARYSRAAAPASRCASATGSRCRAACCTSRNRAATSSSTGRSAASPQGSSPRGTTATSWSAPG